MDSIKYHLSELEVALNKNDNRSILPSLFDHEKVILDIGCGIGQTFLALNCTDRTCIGIDIDQEAIKYGMQEHGNKIQFILADAKQIPLPSNSINLVFSRVSLPYTNIPKVIKEIKRVLKRGGRIWLTLHSKNVANKYLKEAIKNPLDVKRLVHVFYIVINGYLLKYFGVVFPFITGRYESWQDIGAMKKMLLNNSFEVKVYKNQHHTIIEGSLKK